MFRELQKDQVLTPESGSRQTVVSVASELILKGSWELQCLTMKRGSKGKGTSLARVRHVVSILFKI